MSTSQELESNPLASALRVVELYVEAHDVTSGVLLNEELEELALVRATETHGRSFWSGFGVDPVEVSCASPDGAFRWRLYAERQGLRVGLRLSLAGDDAEAERWADQEDHLWTVGEMGRESLEAPRFEADGDTRTLFFRLDDPGPRFRVVVDDGEGELWGTVEADPGGDGWTFRRWDGRPLAGLAVAASDASGQEWAVTPGAIEGALEGLAVEAVVPAVVLLEAEGA